MAKIALVTGGGGDIARAISLKLAKDMGCDIVAADIILEKATQVVTYVEKLGCRGIAVQMDVTQFMSVKETIDRVCSDWGKIDILVNCAGGSSRRPKPIPLWEEPEEAWHIVLGSNLLGTLYCTYAAIRHMVKQRQGNIVNIASRHGLVPQEFAATYSAAKAGVIAFTIAVAKEAGAYGIRVNCVAPGATATEWWKRTHRPQETTKMANRRALGRLTAPEDIANAVAFLVSDAANHITGICLDVSGGVLRQ